MRWLLAGSFEPAWPGRGLAAAVPAAKSRRVRARPGIRGAGLKRLKSSELAIPAIIRDIAKDDSPRRSAERGNIKRAGRPALKERMMDLFDSEKEKEQAEERRRKKLCAMVREEFERRAVQRRPFELQWQLNMNFMLGNQYCDIAPLSGELYETEKEYPLAGTRGI